MLLSWFYLFQNLVETWQLLDDNISMNSLNTSNPIDKQECIPVGYIPTVAVAISGKCLLTWRGCLLTCGSVCRDTPRQTPPSLYHTPLYTTTPYHTLSLYTTPFSILQNPFYTTPPLYNQRNTRVFERISLLELLINWCMTTYRNNWQTNDDGSVTVWWSIWHMDKEFPVPATSGWQSGELFQRASIFSKSDPECHEYWSR